MMHPGISWVLGEGGESWLTDTLTINFWEASVDSSGQHSDPDDDWDINEWQLQKLLEFRLGHVYDLGWV